MRRGDILFDQRAVRVPFYGVISGSVEIVRPCKEDEDPIVVHQTGQFTGETNMLTGRRSLARARVAEDGEVLELDGDALRVLVQTDPGNSEW